jgi:hypothetical protein
VRLDFAVYRTVAELLGDCFSGNVGRFAEARGIACLDFVSQGCSLAIRDRWNSEGFSPAPSRECNDLGYGSESAIL